jgi:hypothetical protein
LTIVLRLLVLVLPFVLTIAFGALIAEGLISLGSGEKDLFLTLPLLLWSLIYAICYVALWWRGAAPGRTLARAALYATVCLIVAWVALAIYASLGFG